MDKKRLITIISIIAVILIIAIVTIVVNKNNSMKKASTVVQNVNEEPSIEETPEEPIEELPEEPTGEIPEETSDPNVKSTAIPKSSANNKYYIKVNNLMNTVTIYTKDEDGNYTKPVKAMICSTGDATPKNVKYSLKGRWEWGPLFGNVYGHYVTQINGDILFHSVPYLKNKPNTLEYWEYDKLGTTASMGCVRLTIADASWIYYNCGVGTMVEFYSSSNPGPLGKPSAMKISSYVEYRNWDPTDPNKNNPWRNAVINVPSPEPTIIPTPDVIPSEEPTQAPTNVPTVIPTNTPKPTLTPNLTINPTPKTTAPIESPTPNIPEKPTPDVPKPKPSEIPSTEPTESETDTE